MINKQFAKKAFGITMLISISFFYSCKEKTITGTDTIPDEDRINTVEFEEDFFEPSLKVQYLDKVYTNHMSNPQIAIGEVINDPFFSSVKASAYIQLAPAGAFYNVPENYQLDSAHLIIPFSGVVFGDTLNIQDNAMTLSVLPVVSGIKNPKLYDNHEDFPLGNTLATVNFDYQSLKEEYKWERDTIKNSLVIPMPNQYIQQILDLPDTEFSSSGIFLENVNGFYLKAQKANTQGSGALYYFDIANNNATKAARIVVHGRQDEEQKDLYFSFQVNETNYLTHLDKTPNPQSFHLYDGEKHTSDSVLIESGPGLYTELTLHNLQDLPASIVHKAIISFVNLPNTQTDLFGVPQQLVIERVKQVNGEEVIEKVLDYGQYDGLFPVNGLKFVGGQMGLLSISGVSHAQYELNFPRLLQEVIKEGAESLTLRISMMNTYPGGFRFIGGGNNHTNERYNIKVKVVATKI